MKTSTTKNIKFIPKPVTLKPMNKKQLFEFYGISRHVLNTWLKSIETELGPMKNRAYSIEQVQLIFKTFGMPGTIVREYRDAA